MPSREVINNLESQIKALGNEPRLISDLETAASASEELNETEGLGFDWTNANGVDDAGSTEPVDQSVDESAQNEDLISETQEITIPGLEDFEVEDSSLENPEGNNDESTLEEISLDDDLNITEESEIAISLGSDDSGDDSGDESEEFSFEDFGDDFNFDDEDFGPEESSEKIVEEPQESGTDQTSGLPLDEKDFLEIRRTLSELPRNLKIAIEELLADENRSIVDLQSIIDLLVNAASPKVLAKCYYKLTNRKIELPRNYKKRSGRILEDQRASISYRLIHGIWPITKRFLMIVAAFWLFAAMIFMWVYRPLKADSLYKKGLKAITANETESAVEYFNDAWYGWPLFDSRRAGKRIADAPVIIKGWEAPKRWIDYARAFRNRKYWQETEKFYAGYLSVKPSDKRARLEYADFLSRVLGKYEAAIMVLDSAPLSIRNNWDRDFTLAAGDIYLDWAEDDPSKYEDARYRYAVALERSRNDERAILSMMLYHLRRDSEQEILTLLPVFERDVPSRMPEGLLAAEVFAGLAEFFLARDDQSSARRFVEMAEQADPSSPYPYYIKAQYLRYTADNQNALIAFHRTLLNLEGLELLDKTHLKMKILSLGGIGRISAGNPDLQDIAMANYLEAVELYEDALSRNQLGASPEYAVLYIDIADLFYLSSLEDSDFRISLNPRLNSTELPYDRLRELNEALNYYKKAENILGRGSASVGLPDRALFRRALAEYTLGRDDALLDFYRVSRRLPESYEVRMTLALTLLESGDYEASRSHYTRSIALLDEAQIRSNTELEPEISASHAEILVRYVIAWNNLGAARALSASRDGSGEAEALGAFTMASVYLDQISTEMKNLIAHGASGLRNSDERRLMEIVGDRRLLADEKTFPYRNRLRLLGLEENESGEDAYLIYSDIPLDITLR